MMNVISRHALVLCAGIALTGCFSAESVIEDSFHTGSDAVVIVETFNGAIEVVGSDRQTVDVEVILRGTGMSREAASDNLRAVEVDLKHENDTVTVKARKRGSTGGAGSPGAEVRLLVPIGTQVDLVTTNGAVEVQGIAGDVYVRTTNGAMQLRGEFFSVDVETTNGALDIETSEPAVVRAVSTNGSVRFTGPLSEEGENRLETTNGSIWAGLPEESAFNLDASTSNGKVSVDFDVTTSGGPFDSNKLKATVGTEPTTNLVLRTTNGSIDVVKY